MLCTGVLRGDGAFGAVSGSRSGLTARATDSRAGPGPAGAEEAGPGVAPSGGDPDPLGP